MPKMIPEQSIVVVRDNKQIIPPIGKSFEFTDAEVKDVEAMNPQAFRKPVVEVADDAPAEVVQSKPAGKLPAKGKSGEDL